MLRIISWNVDSLNAALTSASPRAQLSRDVLKTIRSEDADIIAIQETKLSAKGPEKKHLEALEEYFPGYHVEWVSSEPPARKGYAGTMVLYREGMKAEKIVPRIGAPEPMDDEGRLLVLEYEKFYFVNVYTPNAGDGLKRLSERQVWDKLYADYLAELDGKKPVIACGDFNVAHKEIDLKHPENNHMSAGFTDEEVQWRIENAFADYVYDVPMGGKFYLSKLGSYLLDTDCIETYALDQSMTDLTLSGAMCLRVGDVTIGVSR